MSINLLPWRQIQRQQRYKKRIYRIIIYFVIFIFLSLIIKLSLLIGTRRLDSKIVLVDRNISTITLHDSQYKNELLLKRLIYFHGKQKRVISLNKEIQRILFHIANIIPNSIILQQLSITKDKILLMGKSNQLVDIHQYVNALQSEKMGKSTQLVNIQTDEKNHATMRFTIEITRQEQPHAK